MADDDLWATDEVGIYTSLPRRTWASVRTELMKGKEKLWMRLIYYGSFDLELQNGKFLKSS
jgi:hypothetical protein